MSVTAILVIGMAFFTSAFVVQRDQNDIGIVDLGLARTRLLREVEIGKNRAFRARVPRPALDERERSDLYTRGSHAIAVQDIDGLSAVILDLDTEDAKMAASDEQMRSFKATGSDLFAARARRRRFEADRVLDDLVATESALESIPSSPILREQLKIMTEARTILLSEYSADAKRAIGLNPDNARALYDVARFYQDRHTRFDDLAAIGYFERAESQMRGKMEKDADFVRTILNLAILYFGVGNIEKAGCYASETIEKYKARSDDDLVYLFGTEPNGRLNEPEFVEVNSAVNPDRVSKHPDCRKVF